MGRLTAFVALTSVFTGVVACSLAVQSSREQCASDEACIRHLGAQAKCVENTCEVRSNFDASTLDASTLDAPPSDPLWSCAGKRPDVPVEAVPVRYLARFLGKNDTPYADVPIRGCSSLDVTCSVESPGIGPKSTNADGLLDIMLTSGFRGVLQTLPSEANPSLLPHIVYVSPIPDKNVPVGDPGPDNPRFPTPLFTSADLEAIASAAKSQLNNPAFAINPEFGHVAFLALDCEDKPAVDVTVTATFAEADSKFYYLDESGAPNFALGGKTSSRGRGGYLNLPARTNSFKFLHNGTQVKMTNFAVLKGTVTYVIFKP